MGSGSSGLSEPSRDVLGSSGFCVYMTFRNVFRNTLIFHFSWLVYRTMCSPNWAGNPSGNTLSGERFDQVISEAPLKSVRVGMRSARHSVHMVWDRL